MGEGQRLVTPASPTAQPVHGTAVKGVCVDSLGMRLLSL